METWELLSWLWRASWQASVLVFLVLVAQWVFRSHLAPKWRYALWFLVMARLMLPVMPESSFSIFNVARVNTVATSPGELPVEGGLPETAALAEEPRLEEMAWPNEANAEVAASAAPETNLNAAAENQQEPMDGPLWKFTTGTILVTIFFTGAGLLTLRLLGGYLLFARRLRHQRPVSNPAVLRMFERCQLEMGVGRKLVIIETPDVESPALFGLFRLRLLLPRGILERFSFEELRYIFLHELAHVRRGDVLINWIVTVLQVLHWFNPMVWFGFRRMRADRELACDALVLSCTSEGENKTYGQTILKLLEDFSRPAAVPGLVGIIEDKGQMKRRMRMIAQFRNRRGWSLLAVTLLAVLATFCLTDAKDPSGSVEGAEGNAGAEASTIDLTDFYDLHADETSQFGTWEVVPKGRQVFDGVPFDLEGMIRLFGLIAPPHGTVYRDEVTGIPIGRAFEQLHLLHGTGWTTEDGVPIARAVLNYTDGEQASFLIVYGEHVRDWWHRDLLSHSGVSDPYSRVVWTGEHDHGGTRLGLRFYRSSFTNPHPEKEVSTIDLISERSAVTPAILAISAGPAVEPVVRQAGSGQQLPDGSVEASETEKGKVRLRVVDNSSGEPLPKAGLQVNYCDDRGCFYLGSFQTDENGEKEISYPTANLVSLSVSVVRPGFASEWVTWSADDRAGVPDTHTVKMKLPSGITGQVTDATSGEPVQSFRVMVGQDYGGANSIYWQRAKAFETSSGEYLLMVDDPIEVRAVLRVEAEGYLPALSEPFDMDGGEHNFDFALKPAEPIQGIVRLPNGEILSGVEVGLVTPSSGLTLRKGRLVGRFMGEGGARDVIRTDEQGRFSLTPDPEASAMLFVHDFGYAEIPAGDFSGLDTVVLQPWGRIEGVVMIGSQPGKNEEVNVAPLQLRVSPNSFSYDSSAFTATTDEQGEFALDFVPPGQRAMHRIISIGPRRRSWSHRTFIDVKPGEVTRVQIGGTGRPIIGKLIPDDPDREVDWQSGHRSLTTRLPQPGAFSTREEAENWSKSEEFRQAREQQRSYAVIMEPDGSFRAEDVPAGEYQLSIMVTEPTADGHGGGERIGSLSKTITVPETQAGRSDEPLDLGELEVKLAREITRGAEAPDVEFTDLDGNPLKLSDFRGKYVLLDFWATWCGPCVEETPNLKDTYETFKNDGRFEIVALSLDRDRDAPREYAQKNELEWVQGYLGDWGKTDVPDQFGVQGIPSYFLLDPDGKIVAKGMRGAGIKAAVAEALKP